MAETEQAGQFCAASVSWLPTAADQQRASYAAMVDSLRVLQDSVAAAAPPADVSGKVAQALSVLADVLGRHSVGEDRQLFNRLPEAPGYGGALTPLFLVDVAGPDHVAGRVTFTRFHLGGGGAAHGGATALLFDSVLGRLANSGGRARARTAQLDLTYRRVAPIDREIEVHGRIVHEEGRKRFLTGTLSLGDEVLAEAHGLFVTLLPGQP